MTAEQDNQPSAELPADLLIDSGSPVTLAPVDAQTYPAQPEVEGLELGWSGDARSADMALDYAAGVLGKDRDADLTVLSDRWSSAVILEDKALGAGAPAKVYKVFRRASCYDYVEHEVINLTLLHQRGLAPQPFLLIDAAAQYRSDDYSYPLPPDDTAIMRQDGGGELPIIVMEKIERASIDSMTDEQLKAEFERVLATALELNMILGDTELVYDVNDQAVKFLDAGGIGRYSEGWFGHWRNQFPAVTDEQLRQADTATRTIQHFLAGRTVQLPAMDEMLHIIDLHGLESLGDSLVSLVRNTPAVPYEPLPNHWKPRA